MKLNLPKPNTNYLKKGLKRKSKAGYASVVTTKSNEIVGLLADDRNLQEVKEKLVHVEAAFLKFK